MKKPFDDKLLFSNPYRPSMSPIADNSPVTPLRPSALSIRIPGSPDEKPTVTSPLLNTPAGTMAHYPFPNFSCAGRWKRRVRSVVGGGSLHAGLVKRLLFLFVLGALLVFIGHRHLASLAATKITQRPLAHPVYTDSSPASGSAVPPQRPPFASPPEDLLHDGQQRREIDISSDPLPIEASLRERLDVWKRAPGGRGDVPGEVELGGFVQWNLESCSTILEQHSPHLILKSANVWGSMNRTTLHENRMLLINHMEDVLQRDLISHYGSGRGIVLVAGNADTLRRVKWLLQMLRSYGSTLPVQIYHFPSERLPEDDPLGRELGELGAELVEAKDQEKDAGKSKSYHLKAIAIVQSPWREVLYLDSDSIPTRDPEYMFDAPSFKRLGIWATPDYWKTSANNPIWAIMGVRCRDEWEMETGQMFIDKKRHLDVFLLIKYMLENHHWWFNFSDGDKDIFRWAMLMLRKRWGVPGRWVGAAALPSRTLSGEFCAHTMLQHDAWGEPLFVHYNLLKQIPSGVGRFFSWGRTKQLPLFNTFPALPSTARLGEPLEKPNDDDRRGLGDVDCDMLADADEYGNARAPAKEMIMRRAVRERGVKARFHGGSVSALCVDLEYVDPRPEDRKAEDQERLKLEAEQKAEADRLWSETVEEIKSLGQEEPVRPEPEPSIVLPNWNESPIEIVQWANDPHLATFEKKIYDLGFVPGGPGF